MFKNSLRGKIKSYLKANFHQNEENDWVDSTGTKVFFNDTIVILQCLMILDGFSAKTLTNDIIQKYIESELWNYYCDPVSYKQFRHNRKRIRQLILSKGINSYVDNDEILLKDLESIARYLPAYISDEDLQNILEGYLLEMRSIKRRIKDAVKEGLKK